ncbi:hypothetical protein [Gordonia araii]|nr:hypothetical protein [Gordonia araii]
MGWQPGSLGDAATALGTLQSTVHTESSEAGDPVRDIEPAEWKGKARGAADARAEALTRWLRGVAAEFGELVTALNDGERNIRDARTALRNRTTQAAGEGYILQQASRSYQVDFDASRAEDEDAEFDANTAHQHQTALRQLGEAADQAVTDTRNAINAALGELGVMAPSSLAANRGAVDPRLAAEDKKAVENGTATPAQFARYLRAITFTPEQLERIAAGDFSGISPSRLKYWENLGYSKEDLPGLAASGALSAINKDATMLAKNTDSYRHRSKVHQGAGPNGVARVNQVAKVLGRGTFVAGFALTAYSEWDQYDQGKQDGGDMVAGTAGGIGGGLAGAAAGAALGSMIAPGIGTAIGAGIGGALGSDFGSKGVKFIKGLFG